MFAVPSAIIPAAINVCECWSKSWAKSLTALFERKICRTPYQYPRTSCDFRFARSPRKKTCLLEGSITPWCAMIYALTVSTLVLIVSMVACGNEPSVGWLKKLVSLNLYILISSLSVWNIIFRSIRCQMTNKGAGGTWGHYVSTRSGITHNC